MRNNLWLLLLMALLGAALAQAATIHGTVYDLNLTPVKNSIVEIDTAPAQRMVAKAGSYEFSVPLGEYRIKATYEQSDGTALSMTETLSVKNDGDYVLDLFLFPDLEEEDEILQDIEMDVTEGAVEEEKRSWIMYAVVIGIFIVVLIIFFKLLPLIWKPAKKEEKVEEEPTAGDLDKVVGILKKHDGRMTQKDLRKELPLSEAKVSLMVAELEHRGKVKKIKKGRGNILVLQ